MSAHIGGAYAPVTTRRLEDAMNIGAALRLIKVEPLVTPGPR